MNDRYLFKAKRIDNGEWIVGNLIQTPFMGTVRSWISSESEDKERLRSIATYKAEWRSIEVRTDSICQCTGLKDKNGKLIWENDIINTEVGKAVVGWDYCAWRIKWIQDTIRRKDLWYWVTEEDWHTKVVGNIFDNPELLEVEW